MKIFFYFVIFTFVLSLVDGKKKTKTNTKKLVKVTFIKEHEFDDFRKFAHKEKLDVWRLTKKDADTVVDEPTLPDLESLFHTEIQEDDIDGIIEAEAIENNLEKKKSTDTNDPLTPPITYFAPYQEKICPWLATLIDERCVSIQSIGQSYERREMLVVRIGCGSQRKDTAVFITSGMHSREWLPVASVLFTINKMISMIKSNSSEIMNLLDKMDFYFLPVANPDGYDRTHNVVKDRMWRKTVTPQKDGCFGADPNRNFDAHFGEAGVNLTDACHLTYPGPHPFSEPCAENIKAFAENLNGRLKLFMDIHAYGLLYFVPYAYSKTDIPADNEELRRVASISATAMEKVNQRHYSIGTTGELIYEASGSVMDWMKLKNNVKYSYTLELYPELRHPHNGFIVPRDAIKPTGEELFAGILSAAANIETSS